MYPVSVAKVAAAMGGALVLGSVPHTTTELAEAIARGLPRQVAIAVAANVALDSAWRGHVRDRVIAPARFRRSLTLTVAAGERAERVARIMTLATEALGNERQARTWLAEPHPGLQGRVPLAIVTDQLGARQVERLLLSIQYGMPA